jgi:hypothetical protein
VLRPPSLPHALAVVASLVSAVIVGAVLPAFTAVLVPGATPTAAALPRDPDQPLVVRMHSITPDYIPDHGPIVIHGTVTNRSTEKWTSINVHAFISSFAMTTTAELAEATQTPVTADVGSRIIAPGTFDHIDSLEPGQSSRFTVRLPRSKIPVSAPGVYWFGVHVLGADPQGRSNNAVGRDRTFIPLVPEADIKSGQVEDTALVIPVRAGVIRGFDGSVDDPSQWTDSLRDGPLHDALSWGEAAQGNPVSWLLDPAVPDVVRSLAAGNPPRTLTLPGSTGPGGPSTSPSPSASPSPTGTGAAATVSGADESVARRWLRRLHQLLAVNTAQILGMPYGDPAIDTASQYDEPLLHAAIRHTGNALRPWHLPLASVAAPPTGRIESSSIDSLPTQTDLLLPDTGLVGTAPVVNELAGHHIVFSSSGAAEGGPGPVDPLSSLALRQRILSEAALRLLDGRQPLIVELPTRWHRRVPLSFFTGLDVPWLRLTTLQGATAGTAPSMSADQLRAPDPASQLGPRLYAAANRVMLDSHLLQTVLTGNNTLEHQMFAEVAGNASYEASEDPYAALARMRNTAAWVHSKLQDINLSAPQSVTLASTSGHFSTLISNNLDVPVTVKVRAVADPRLRISGAETPVKLAPHGRTTVLLSASTHRLGVHNVTLQLTNLAGVPLGSADQFPIRAEQVSQLIWVIIGAGIALLFAAIVIRLVRRILGTRTS